jgi:hypothetical protein
MKKQILIFIAGTVLFQVQAAEEQLSFPGSEETTLFTLQSLLGEEDARLESLINGTYKESFVNEELPLEKQDELLTEGITFLNDSLSELQKNSEAHLTKIQKIFGKPSTRENLTRCYTSLLKKETTRQKELKETLLLAQAAAQITQEERDQAAAAAHEKQELEKKRTAIKEAVAQAHALQAQKAKERSVPMSALTATYMVVETDDTPLSQLVLNALDHLANRSDIHTALDYQGPGFCPACGPLTQEEKAHQSHRRNGQKISLKAIKSIKDLDTFIKKDPRDLRRQVIAETIRALGDNYSEQARRDLETIFRYNWIH